jgi:hypothetical protein
LRRWKEEEDKRRRGWRKKKIRKTKTDAGMETLWREREREREARVGDSFS